MPKKKAAKFKKFVEPETHFLNVDLDLDIEKGKDDLIAALKNYTYILNQEGKKLSLELSLPDELESPEITIREFVKLIEKLPPKLRTIWNKAKTKTFNIGIRAGERPHSATFALPRDVIRLIDSVDADVIFTVYGSTQSVMAD